jgi:Protein of unknown function (DUF2637)
VTGILRGPRRAALAVIAAVLAAASVVALAESYRGLYDWARGHGLPGGWAAVWPLQVDTFLVVGELALFVALVDRWPTRARVPAWAVTLAGLGVSIAGNVGHVHGHNLLIRATAAVPPLAAASALAVGLGVLKRVVERHHEATREAGARATVKGTTKAKARAAARPPAKAIAGAGASGLDAAAKAAIEATRQGHPVPSARELARTYHIGRDKAGEVRAMVLAQADGHSSQPGPLTT